MSKIATEQEAYNIGKLGHQLQINAAQKNVQKNLDVK